MYISSLITQTFLSIFLFELGHTTTAKDVSGLMRLQPQRRTLTDSPLPETFFPWDNYFTPEEIPSTELTTASGNVPVDKGGSEQEQQNQQQWIQQDPVELLLTDCTNTGTTDHSDQSSLIPSAKFQRRLAQDPNSCPARESSRAGQLKLQQGEQGQEGERGTDPGDGQVGEEAKPQKIVPPGIRPYPNHLDLFNLRNFGRMGDSHEICSEFVGQNIPMCASISNQARVSPSEVIVPGRFCKWIFFLVEFWLWKVLCRNEKNPNV